MLSGKITAVVINYQTPDLTEEAIQSLKNFYPDLNLILIDNGSKDDSIQKLMRIVSQFKKIEVIVNIENINHGPAMNQAIRLVKSDYVLFLDSDCKILRGGFLEEMYKLLQENELNYVVGKMMFLNKRGFPVEDPERGHPYIRPICMMLKTEIYRKLRPFKKHGAPCLENMMDAIKKGYKLINFEVEEYILHKGRGTASKFGYNLGIKGKLNYILNKLKI